MRIGTGKRTGTGTRGAGAGTGTGTGFNGGTITCGSIPGIPAGELISASRYNLINSFLFGIRTGIIALT